MIVKKKVETNVCKNGSRGSGRSRKKNSVKWGNDNEYKKMLREKIKVTGPWDGRPINVCDSSLVPQS